MWFTAWMPAELGAVELKFAVMLALVMVTFWLAGVMLNPALVGVTVYEPAANPVKL